MRCENSDTAKGNTLDYIGRITKLRESNVFSLIQSSILLGIETLFFQHGTTHMNVLSVKWYYNSASLLEWMSKKNLCLRFQVKSPKKSKCASYK